MLYPGDLFFLPQQTKIGILHSKMCLIRNAKRNPHVILKSINATSHYINTCMNKSICAF